MQVISEFFLGEGGGRFMLKITADEEKTDTKLF
jgi:hypothetical protein